MEYGNWKIVVIKPNGKIGLGPCTYWSAFQARCLGSLIQGERYIRPIKFRNP